MGLLNYSSYSQYIKFQPTLARGQEYYTGNIFEVYAIDSGIKSSIGGGGRYDKLITNWIQDGNSYPAVGISFGLNVIYEILKNREEFIEQAKSCSVNYVLIDVEKEWYKNNYKSEQKVRQLFKLVRYFEKYTEKSCLNWGHNSSVCCAIEDYHSLYDDTF